MAGGVRVLLAALLVAATPVLAATPDLARYKHSSWTRDDGAPEGIRALAQTPDGYLWVAGQDGLFRFDGVHFERVSSPRLQTRLGSAPRALAVDFRGNLWIGYDQGGGIAVYRGGKVVDTAMPDPPPIILGIMPARDGTIWANWGGWENRLWRYRKGRWDSVEKEYALPFGALFNGYSAPDGTLWFGLWDPRDLSSHALRLAPGSTRFATFPTRGRYPAVANDRRGRLWLSDTKGTGRILPGRLGSELAAVALPAAPDLVYPTIRFDHRNALWGTSRSGGIFHARARDDDSLGTLELLRARDGLTSDLTNAILVDREGNVWIGTEQGLDRFRPIEIVAEGDVPVNPRGSMTIAQAADGTVYIGSAEGIYEIRAGAAPKLRKVVKGQLQVICPARNGSIWLVHTGHAVRLGDAETGRIPIPGPPGPIHACTEDAQGRLWLTGENALRWHDATGWHRVPSKGLGGGGTEEVVTAPDGRVVFNIRGARFGIISGTSVRSESAAGLGIGYVNGLTRVLDYVLVNGTTGVARIRDGRISVIRAGRYPWAARLRDAVQTPAGDTWLLATAGLVRVKTAELDRAFDNPGSPVTADTFDSRDGLASGPQHYGIRGTQIAVGGDGRLWILTRTGAFRLDPSRLKGNKIPPVVSITGVTAGDLNVRDPRELTLAEGTSSLAISYTALSLTVPARNQFRYRLEGVDDGWVDPGSRRQAFYTRLGPGTYRFHVIAANNDGAWNRTGATLKVVIPPTFVQSWPFFCLCGLAACGVAAMLYSARLRYLTRRIRAQMEARLAERERIAQDLHDTLLQGIQGLMIRFHGLALRPELDRATKREIDEALDQAEAALVEGREQVAGLRSARVTGLPLQLEEFIAGLRREPGPVLFLSVDGEEKLVEPLVAEEALKISREAILNATRHAGASRIAVNIDFRPDRFLVTVEDDGVGIDEAIIAAGGREGHFGLRGMAERAQRVGGALSIETAQNDGARIVLEVPARVAYLRQRRPSPLRRTLNAMADR
ncbi:hypothetical protein C7I55_03365 [Sphingomonas deserti]|uniref:Histidine kinase/HSP90-like ATPase domain-containing protein n=2 Tax=Allosphingosinicella deserti TaxID=2116704 RepID=A0A2P7QZL5_9SPHN|nr:hypothetical protein C7I55_03365 [Sphingomonas deserti]